MPSARQDPLEIRPARPDDVTASLLAVVSAEQRPLPAGDLLHIPSEPEEYTLAAALQGSCTASALEGYALLGAGQVLCWKGPCLLQGVSDGTYALVRLRGELAARLLGPCGPAETAPLAQGAGAVRALAAALAVLEREHAPVDGCTASAHAYAMLMKLRAFPAGAAPVLTPLVESAIAVIQEEFPYLEGVEELADRLEVSKAHLIRSFVKKTGVTPGKYLTRVRVEYAKLLLSDEDASVAYAAGASGFANANYFAKVFRKETGMSPTEYLESIPRRRAGVRRSGMELERRSLMWEGENGV